MRINNQGVTLIELVVVMLIIGVLAGGAAIGIRGLDSGNARSTVKRVDALLNYVRVLNMTKENDYYLYIEQINTTIVARIQSRSSSGTETDVMTEKLKLKNGDVTYRNRSGHEFSVASGDVLELGFQKASGSIKTSPDGEITRMIIKSQGRTQTIRLVTATGKHYIDE